MEPEGKSFIWFVLYAVVIVVILLVVLAALDNRGVIFIRLLDLLRP